MTGIVLAGGRSTRFGSDKLTAIYRGEPLLHHAVHGLAEICGDVVVVISFAGAQPSLPDAPNIRVVRDAHEAEGPLEGLVAALEDMSTDLAVVAGGDMPDLSKAVLHDMIRIANETPSDAVALQDADADPDGFRSLPAVVRVKPSRDAARSLLRAGERSLRTLLTELDVTVLGEAMWRTLDPNRGTLRDIDEPVDLES